MSETKGWRRQRGEGIDLGLQKKKKKPRWKTQKKECSPMGNAGEVRRRKETELRSGRSISERGGGPASTSKDQRASSGGDHPWRKTFPHQGKGKREVCNLFSLLRQSGGDHGRGPISGSLSTLTKELTGIHLVKRHEF